jgi:hypothetical protein
VSAILAATNLALLVAGVVIAMQPAQATLGAPAACSPTLRGVTLAPASVPDGASSTVTATVSCAPAKALTVALVGFNGAHVPSALHVAAGKASASGTITTATRTKAVLGWITEKLGTASQRALLTIGVTPKTCKSPALSGGTKVTLKSSSSTVVMPATVTIPAGVDEEVFAPTRVGNVTANTVVVLSAGLGGRTVTSTTKVLGPWALGDPVTVSPVRAGPVYGGTIDVQFSVQLGDPAPATYVNVTASSDNPAVEVETRAADIFNTTTTIDVDTASVTSSVHATLTFTLQTLAGAETVPIALTVEPGLATVTVPSTITSGDSATGTVTLAGLVDVATPVSLQSTSGSLTVPSSVVIQPGQSSATFPIGTKAGASGQQVTIQAFLDDENLDAETTLS